MRNLRDLQVFLAGDYSQIEIRMLAEASGDPVLIRHFRSGQDVHCLVGRDLTGWSVEKISKDKKTRTAVKEFHFQIVYGGGKEHGHEDLRSKGVKITREQFDRYYDRYFATYKFVSEYIRKCREEAERTGRVETIFGFRRPIEKNDDRRASFWGNQAINSPIQGAAHQLVLIALALLHLKPRTYRLLQHPVMEVHDELLFRVRLGDLPAADRALRYLLQTDVAAYVLKHWQRKLRVPLVAETEAGFCRGSMVEYEDRAIDSVEGFLREWRAKHRAIAAKPLETLLPKIVIQ